MQPLWINAPDSPFDGKECNCPVVSDVHKTTATNNSFSFAWTGNSDALNYEVYYVRSADGQISQPELVAAESHQFNNLQQGGYTFYVRAVCIGGPSGFVGIEDVIEF